MQLLQINEALTKGESWLIAIKSVILVYGLQLGKAVLVYVIGMWLIGYVSKMMRRVLMLRHFDASLQTFLLSAFKVSMTIMLSWRSSVCSAYRSQASRHCWPAQDWP